MSTKVSNATSVSDLTLGLAQTGGGGGSPSPQPERPAPAVQDQADFRLVIEEDPNTGSFIYKTLDRRTGEIVNQWPREQVLRLRQEAAYRAGAIISAKA